MELTNDYSRKIFAYDTFEGMTEPDENDFDISKNLNAKILMNKDKEKKTHIWGICSLEDVKNNTIDENDMNAYDNYNLAYDADMKSIVDQLHDQLYKTWDNQSWAINFEYR